MDGKDEQYSDTHIGERSPPQLLFAEASRNDYIRFSPLSFPPHPRMSMSLLREAQKCIANQTVHKNLNAFISLPTHVEVLRAARQAEENRTSGPLHGKLVAIKDNIC